MQRLLCRAHLTRRCYATQTGAAQAQAPSYLTKNEENFQLIHTVRNQLMRDQALSVEESFAEMDRLIALHRAGDTAPLEVLAPLMPKYGAFFTPLPLTNAFKWYNNRHHFAKRQHVPPSDDELRHVFNVSQLMTMVRAVSQHTLYLQAPHLKLLSFDGDQTLYENMRSMKSDSPIIPQLLQLLGRGVNISLTTAVGAETPDPYMDRLGGLLDALAGHAQLEDPAMGDVLVMGGQCNYLYKLDKEALQLVPVPEGEWKTEEMMGWDEERVPELLSCAMDALKDCSKQFRLPMRFIEKKKAVGALFVGELDGMTQLYLDEVALEVRHRLSKLDLPVPYCCFNGGVDVFVDIGSKQQGIQALQQLVGVEAHQTLHFGDQFSRTGNDLLARRACPTCWITSPLDTELHLKWLIGFFEKFEQHQAATRAC